MNERQQRKPVIDTNKKQVEKEEEVVQISYPNTYNLEEKKSV